MTTTTFAVVLAALVAAVHCSGPILPYRAYNVTATGVMGAATGYEGPASTSKLFQPALAEGWAWNVNTMYVISNYGPANAAVVEMGDYVCSVTQISVQADNNDDSYVDYYANGVWTPIAFGTCKFGENRPGICTSYGHGLRTKTISGLNLQGVTKFRAYAGATDTYNSFSRLFAEGECTPGGILPQKSVTVSTTGTMNVPSGYTGAGLTSALHQPLLSEGSAWQTDTIWWSPVGSDRSVVVDLDGACDINKLIIQVDNNDQYNVDYYTAGQWNAVALGSCINAGTNPGECASYGIGMRTNTLSGLTVTGATKLRLYCIAGDNSCSVSRLYAFGTCGPASAASTFCDDIATMCTNLAAECDIIRNNNHVAIADDCDTAVAACNDVVLDCHEKAATCPLV